MIPMARPRIVVDGGEIFYVFRDEERGSKVSLAHATDVANSKWSISDLTDFAVDAWEPSHDTELWKSRKRLHLFVQHAKQGEMCIRDSIPDYRSGRTPPYFPYDRRHCPRKSAHVADGSPANSCSPD